MDPVAWNPSSGPASLRSPFFLPSLLGNPAALRRLPPTSAGVLSSGCLAWGSCLPGPTLRGVVSFSIVPGISP